MNECKKRVYQKTNTAVTNERKRFSLV